MTIRPSGEEQDEPAALTILVVEDEAIIRLDLSGYLRSQGHHVLEAFNVDEAIRILEKAVAVEVSAVFSDIRMPGTLDGFDLARYVKEHHPSIAVLLTSGHMPASELHEELGELISKPYRNENVLLKIEKLLTNAGLRNIHIRS